MECHKDQCFGPLLFIIIINDVDVGIVSEIPEFADDTKCLTMGYEEEAVTLRDDLRTRTNMCE